MVPRRDGIKIQAQGVRYELTSLDHMSAETNDIDKLLSQLRLQMNQIRSYIIQFEINSN
jgi:hypothetical protein